jgi:thiol-disulfide isomerase/thioredoxin
MTRLIPIVLCLWLAVPPLACAQLGQFVPAASTPAADFRLPDRDGRTIFLSGYKGKVVLVNFWATWCIPCREEMPALERLWRNMKSSSLAVIAVDVGDDDVAIRSFLQRIDPPPSFTIALDRDLTVTTMWHVEGMPTSFLIGADGRIAFQAVGAVEFDSAKTIELVHSLFIVPRK